MWCLSFTALGVQYSMSDVLGWEMTVQCSDGCDEYGQPMKPYILDVFTNGNINNIVARSSTGTYSNSDSSDFDKVINFSTAAAHVAWDVILLLTGTYIFNFLYFMGVPLIFVVGFGIAYAVFLIRAIFGYIRGV